MPKRIAKKPVESRPLAPKPVSFDLKRSTTHRIQAGLELGLEEKYTNIPEKFFALAVPCIAVQNAITALRKREYEIIQLQIREQQNIYLNAARDSDVYKSSLAALTELDKKVDFLDVHRLLPLLEEYKAAKTALIDQLKSAKVDPLVLRYHSAQMDILDDFIAAIKKKIPHIEAPSE